MIPLAVYNNVSIMTVAKIMTVRLVTGIIMLTIKQIYVHLIVRTANIY